MRATGVIVGLLLLTAAAVQCQDLNQAFRNMIEHKISELGDPMVRDTLEIVDFEALGLVSLDGAITELRVDGGSNIQLNVITLDEATLSGNVDILVPRLYATARNYDLRGRFGALIPIFGNGGMTVEVQNVRLVGTYRLSSNGGMRMESARITTTMGGLVCGFQNLLLGEELGELMNYIIGDLVPFMLRNQAAAVTNSIEPQIIERFNEPLSEFASWEQFRNRIMEFA